MTGDTETEVKHELTDRGVGDLSKAALVAEWKQSFELSQQSFETDEEYNRVYGRRAELWSEMRKRTDAEPPECPECGSQKWHQSLGDPKHCGGCYIELGDRHEELIAEINAYWQKVRAVSGGAGA